MFGTGFRGPWVWGDIEREIRRLHGELNRPSPAINIYQGEQAAMLTAEIPGIEPEDIGITVKGSTVTLEIASKPEEAAEGRTYLRRERGGAVVTRTVELPFNVEAADAKATFTNGVLYLTLPQSEAERPIKITVN